VIEQESHAHAHHTGLPWLDLILAGSAIFISIVSVIISIQHGHTMEKLVAANEKQVRASTLPILRFTTGNFDSTDKVKMIHFDLANGGTGPALIEWLRIKWNGVPTAGPHDLLERCCGNGSSAASSSIWMNIASGMNLPAADSQRVFYVRSDDSDPDFYKRLDLDARFKVEAEACYCSVLDECWVTNFKSRATGVKACEAVPDNERW
jgi:hypothetical protein